ncbi:hypothetical protein ACWEOI_31515 [Nocardia sp. NPDC004340]
MTAQASPELPTLTEPDTDEREDTSPLRYFGWYLTVIGISHLIFPRPWDRMTAIAYRAPLRPKTLAFGVTETAMGIMFLRKRTRPLGVLAVTAQVLFLVRSFITFRRGGVDAV